MEHFDKEFCLEVWGPMACFTRPELKVERVSYDVITPSAARAIFEAIFWKPAIHWQGTQIEVLNEIKWTTIRRNEVGAVASKSPIFIEDKRQQKNTLLLQNVRYRLWAKLEFIPQWKRAESKNPQIDSEEAELLRKDENPGKYNAMFERRAKKGQCFNQPYLGFSRNNRSHSHNCPIKSYQRTYGQTVGQFEQQEIEQLFSCQSSYFQYGEMCHFHQ